MNLSEVKLKEIIQNMLNDDIEDFSVKGNGMCNNAYYIKTKKGDEYLVKEERVNKEVEEENDLLIEARVIKTLNGINPSLLIPQIIFISEIPKMYCYKYIEGKTMRSVWSELTEEKRKTICELLGKFHYDFGKLLSQEEVKKIGMQVDVSTKLEDGVVDKVNKFLIDKKLPKKYIELAKDARNMFNSVSELAIFGFCHNDSHHENIIINNNGEFASVIDFGDTGWRDIYNEFTRYAQDYPDYFEIILKVYEDLSGNKLSRKRLLSLTILYSIGSIQKKYHKGNKELKEAEDMMEKYADWLSQIKSE